ncbi:hypothetical protein L0337_20555 [candidate division KSB1 bacterium]|nr:hypothetical protein [candidate division KSB1 bacterium]
MNLSLQEILDDLHAAERELQNYEKKYHLRSETFYDYFLAGVIDDEGNADFQAWAGIIEIKRDLERRYKQFFLLQTPFPENIKSLIANGVVAG